jgi:hypothetical protein
MGVQVQLLRGSVTIRPDRQEVALAALKLLDTTRTDLMGGWQRSETGERIPHWSFVAPGALQSVDTLADALSALRFSAVVDPDGVIVGVDLIDRVRSKGDEFHHWSALAPFVEAGGVMDWYDQDQNVWRWSFNGESLRVIPGHLSFDQ